MKKKSFFLLFVFFTSTLSFAIDYWFLDVTVSNSLLRTSSVERAYFFRDLRTLENATGFPIKDNEERDRYRWRWVEPDRNTYPGHAIQMFDVMYREGLGASFVQSSSGTSISGRRYWIYSVFIISNGREYWDTATLYNSPVDFPRR